MDQQSNFLSDFVELNRETEIPPIFALWSGIGGLSCALGRRVWIDLGIFSVFPNLYILLVAGSGRMRKSTSILQAERLVRQLDPPLNLTAQKLTPEAFFDALRQTSTSPKTLLSESATAFGFTDEMSTFLNRSSYEAGLAPLLIKSFDCSECLDYRTKGRGLETLKDVCFGFLAASTVEGIRKGLPPEAVGDGLASRIIFVYTDKPSPPVPIPRFTEEQKRLTQSCLKHLQRVTMIEGEIMLTRDAWDFYSAEYIRWSTSSPLYDDPHLGGYASRRCSLHMLKIATIFSASEMSLTEKNGLLITVPHLVGAVKALELCETNLKLVTGLLTASDKGGETNTVKNILIRAKRISRSDLLRQVSWKMNSRELSEVIDTLIHSNQVQAELSSNGGLYYNWLG